MLKDSDLNVFCASRFDKGALIGGHRADGMTIAGVLHHFGSKEGCSSRC